MVPYKVMMVPYVCFTILFIVAQIQSPFVDDVPQFFVKGVDIAEKGGSVHQKLMAQKAKYLKNDMVMEWSAKKARKMFQDYFPCKPGICTFGDEPAYCPDKECVCYLAVQGCVDPAEYDLDVDVDVDVEPETDPGDYFPCKRGKCNFVDGYYCPDDECVCHPTMRECVDPEKYGLNL